jgi:hypothetical protein
LHTVVAGQAVSPAIPQWIPQHHPATLQSFQVTMRTCASLQEAFPATATRLGKLIGQRPQGPLRFDAASLYALSYRLEKPGWIRCRWVEKRGQKVATRKPASLVLAGQRLELFLKCAERLSNVPCALTHTKV